MAGRNPGHANWLSTADHPCGAMLLRYVEARDYPPVTTRVVSLEQLETELKEDRSE